MKTDEENILESTRQVSRLYHDHVTVNKAIELMRDQDINAGFVVGIYNQL
jgi:hypothetical protein